MLSRFLSLTEISLKLYPFIIVFFILLDINVFCFLFEFQPGYLKLLISDINIFDFHLVFMLILIPILLLLLSAASVYLSYDITKLIKDTSKIQKVLKTLLIPKYGYLNHWAVHMFCILLFSKLYTLGFMELINLQYHYKKDLLISTVLLLLSFSMHIGVLRYIFELKSKSTIKEEYFSTCVFIMLLLISITLTIISNNDEYKNLSNYTFYFSLIAFLTFFSTLEIKPNKLNKVNNPLKLTLNKEHWNISEFQNKNINLIKSFIGILILSFVYIQFLNSEVWSKEITNKDLKIQGVHFNLLFNKGLLMQNTTDFEVELSKARYTKIYEKFSELKGGGMDNLLIDIHLPIKTKFQPPYKYKIDDNFWYLDISNTKKVFFRNLYVYDSNEKKKTAVGYLIFLIEERKYQNIKDIDYNIIRQKIYIYNKKLVKQESI